MVSFRAEIAYIVINVTNRSTIINPVRLETAVIHEFVHVIQKWRVLIPVVGEYILLSKSMIC